MVHLAADRVLAVILTLRMQLVVIPVHRELIQLMGSIVWIALEIPPQMLLHVLATMTKVALVGQLLILTSLINVMNVLLDILHHWVLLLAKYVQSMNTHFKEIVIAERVVQDLK